MGNIKSEMLKRSLERQLKIRSGEAEKMIEDYVNEILLALRKKRYFRLEGIGYLMQTTEKSIILKDTFWKRCRLTTISAIG